MSTTWTTPSSTTSAAGSPGAVLSPADAGYDEARAIHNGLSTGGPR